MQNASEKIEHAVLDCEFRVCPSCGYELGFHLALVANVEGESHRVILICPNCGTRHDIGKEL